jgi:hypothetical protein
MVSTASIGSAAPPLSGQALNFGGKADGLPLNNADANWLMNDVNIGSGVPFATESAPTWHIIADSSGTAAAPSGQGSDFGGQADHLPLSNTPATWVVRGNLGGDGSLHFGSPSDWHLV